MTFHPIFSTILVVFALLVGTADDALSKQGYHTYFESLPVAVQKWVPRTYMVYDEVKKVPFGSAFLVHNDGLEAHFLTANHVAYHCLGKGTCSLQRGTVWTRENLLDNSIINILKLEITEVLIFDPRTPDWKGATAAADLAYMKVNSNSSVALANITELGMGFIEDIKKSSPFQRKHFALGYPALDVRPSYKSKSESQEIRLRWSEGEMIGLRKIMTKYNVATDVDTLPGNSGGPVIFEDGRLLGILIGGPMSYEYLPFPVMYSYIVPIDTAKRFIGDILLKKPNYISVCNTPYGKNQKSCQDQPFTLQD